MDSPRPSSATMVFWVAIVITACSSIKLTPDGERVQVAERPDVVAECELKTTFSVLSDRYDFRAIQARNKAADAGADTIVAIGELIPGMMSGDAETQKYEAYVCR